MRSQQRSSKRLGSRGGNGGDGGSVPSDEEQLLDSHFTSEGEAQSGEDDEDEDETAFAEAAAAAAAAEDAEDAEVDALDEATIAWATRPPPKSIWGRVCYEASDVKDAVVLAINWYTLVAFFVAFCAAYYAAVGRFSYRGGHGRTTHTVEGVPRHSVDMAAFAKNVRVLPEAYEVAQLKHDFMHLRSTIGTAEDSPGEWSNVTLGMHAATHYVHGHTHMRLPPVWFDCMHVGIAAHDLIKGPNATSPRELEDTKRRLLVELQTAEKPAPSDVLPWYGEHNRTGFTVEGYVARYCLADLQKQGMYTKSKGADAFAMPYARAIRKTDKIGRAVGQLVTLHWYQHQWGAGSVEDPLEHTSILQDINPIRSGVQALRYTGVAYRTNAPVPPIDPGVQRIDMSHLANI